MNVPPRVCAKCKPQIGDSNSMLASLRLSGAALLLGVWATTAATEESQILTAYGQLSFGGLSVDDGVTRNSGFVDNGNSGTRIGFRYNRPLWKGTFRFRFESALSFRSSSEVSQFNLPDLIDFGERSIRHLDFSYEGQIGTFSIGQGSMAADGVTSSDLSGTTLAATSSISDVAASFAFTDQNGILTPVLVGTVFRNLDAGRRVRLRYDSPERNGFVLSAALGTEVLNSSNSSDYYDVALRYNRQIGAYDTNVALGYERVETVNVLQNENLTASASVLHRASGLNVSIATGTQLNGNEARYVYGKLGVRRALNRFGETRLSVDYYYGQDFALVGSQSKSLGFAVVQELEDRNAEAFLLVRQYAIDDPTPVSYQDMTAVFVGARWKF